MLASLVAEWVTETARHTTVDGADGIQNDAEPPPAAAPAPRRVAAGDAITVAVLLGLLAARLGHLGVEWPAYATARRRCSTSAMVAGQPDGRARGSASAGWPAASLACAGAFGRPLASLAHAVGFRGLGHGPARCSSDRPAGYRDVALVRLGDAQPATLAQVATAGQSSSTCGPPGADPAAWRCPSWPAAQRRHPDIGFLFVNQGESAEKVHALLTRSGLALDEVWLDQGSRLGAAVRSPGLPTTFLLDVPGPPGRRAVGLLSAASLQHGWKRCGVSTPARKRGPGGQKRS